MALQSSGQISINNIATELGFTPPFSLRNLSNAAGKTSPDSIGEFYGYSSSTPPPPPPPPTPSHYFVVVNKTSRTGRRSGRRELDGNAYDLYQKYSSDNLGIGSYTLLNNYPGDIKTGENGQTLTFSHNICLTDVTVYTDSLGARTYTISSNSRGNSFYINLIQPYL